MCGRILATIGFILLTSNILLTEAIPHGRSKTTDVDGRRLRGRQEIDADDWSCAPIFTESDVTLFDAGQVRDCLRTVPFSPEVAQQFLQYYRDSVFFQSTLQYLRNPPSSYQQPAVDILVRLVEIQSKITNEEYTYEYEFESALQSVVHDAHDYNVWLDAGAMSVFTFGSSFAISSVSSDGRELPRPYVTNDLIESQAGNSTWSASPIESINGEDAVSYLTSFAAQHSWGLLDPHADWNSLMWTPAVEIQDYATDFTGQTSFYPGEWLNVTFANGTESNTRWLSIAHVPEDIPLISSGLDFYYFFVLGIYPEDLEGGSDGSESSKKLMKRKTESNSKQFKRQDDSQASEDATSWSQATGVSAFPDNPVVVQPSLGNGGLITGYHLENSVAVLSIPDFLSSPYDDSIFPDTVARFIRESKDAGTQKIIIDVQQNFGSEEDLAVNVFQQFFPSIQPYRGSRMRVSSSLQALGETFTQYWSDNRVSFNETYEAIFTDLSWAVLNNINAETGENFTSFGEYYGPHAEHGDLFTAVQRLLVNTSDARPPFAPDDIVILTDSICHSACAAFVEMMHHDAGVRTMTIGGRPNKGPMQAVAGNRGSLELDTHDLDADMYVAAMFNETSQSVLPRSHLDADNLNLWLTSATFNLKDRVRGVEGEGPLQFAYEAANCRIYWTPSTFNNFGNLWDQVAGISWRGVEGCVEDSAQHTNYTTNMDGPSEEQKQSWGGYIPSEAPLINANITGSAQNLTGRASSDLAQEIRQAKEFAVRSPSFQGVPRAPAGQPPRFQRPSYPRPSAGSSSNVVPPAAISASPNRQFATQQKWPQQRSSPVGQPCSLVGSFSPQARNLQCVSVRECVNGGAAQLAGRFLQRCDQTSCGSRDVCRPAPNYSNPAQVIGSNPCQVLTSGGGVPSICNGPKYCFPPARADATCQAPTAFDPALDSAPPAPANNQAGGQTFSQGTSGSSFQSNGNNPIGPLIMAGMGGV